MTQNTSFGKAVLRRSTLANSKHSPNDIEAMIDFVNSVGYEDIPIEFINSVDIVVDCKNEDGTITPKTMRYSIPMLLEEKGWSYEELEANLQYVINKVNPSGIKIFINIEKLMDQSVLKADKLLQNFKN